MENAFGAYKGNEEYNMNYSHKLETDIEMLKMKHSQVIHYIYIYIYIQEMNRFENKLKDSIALVEILTKENHTLKILTDRSSFSPIS